MIAEDRRRYEQHKEQGRSARRVGKKLDANPYRNKPTVRAAESAWDEGWREVDMGEGRRA